MSEFTIGGVIQVLTAQCAAFEALLLMVSAVHKVVKRSRLQNAVLQFAAVPPSLAVPALAGAAICELGAAGLLVVPACRAIGAALAASIWAAYLWLILRAIVQGRRDVDCGCSFGPARRPLGAFQVARNAVLFALAVLVASGSVVSGAVPVQLSHLLAACALVALYVASDQVTALQPLRGGEVA